MKMRCRHLGFALGFFNSFALAQEVVTVTTRIATGSCAPGGYGAGSGPGSGLGSGAGSGAGGFNGWALYR